MSQAAQELPSPESPEPHLSLVSEDTQQSAELDLDFARFYEATYTQLYRTAVRLTEGDISWAEDLVQQTYYRAVRGFNAFEGRSKGSSWLHRILINVFRDELSSKKATVILGANDMALFDELADTDRTTDPEAALLDGETYRQFREDLEQIPPRMANALRLSVLGLGMHAVAGIMGGSTGNVKSQNKRGRDKLKKIWDARAAYES